MLPANANAFSQGQTRNTNIKHGSAHNSANWHKAIECCAMVTAVKYTL